MGALLGDLVNRIAAEGRGETPREPARVAVRGYGPDYRGELDSTEEADAEPSDDEEECTVCRGGGDSMCFGCHGRGRQIPDAEVDF